MRYLNCSAQPYFKHNFYSEIITREVSDLQGDLYKFFLSASQLLGSVEDMIYYHFLHGSYVKFPCTVPLVFLAHTGGVSGAIQIRLLLLLLLLLLKDYFYFISLGEYSNIR